jgi:outer membrane receptor protein involved in Fe transport
MHFRHLLAVAVAIASIGACPAASKAAERALSSTPSPSDSPSPAPHSSIGRVTVASKTRHALSTLPVQADLIGSQEVRSVPGRTIESSLATIPGYSQASTSSWFLGQHSNYADLRGLGPGSVLVTLDGVPINDPLGSWVTWGRVPKLLVDSIEAAHGGASALYGSEALGGVIAIETVHPTRNAVGYDLATGNLGTSSSAFDVQRVLGGGWGASVYLDRDDAKGYIRGATPNSNSPLDPYARYIGQHFNVELSHGDRTSGLIEFGTADQDEHRSGDFAGPTWYYGRSGFARYERDAGNTSVQAVAYLANDSYTFDRFAGNATSYFPIGFGRMSLDTTGATLSVSRRLGPVTVTAGADGRNVAGDRNEPRFTTPSTFVTGNQQFAGTFLQADASLGKSELIVGTRYDVYSQRQAQETIYGTASGFTPFPSTAAHHVSPRASYRYELAPHWLVRASFGDAFKAPDWGNLYSTYPMGGATVVVGNPLLKAQTTDQTEGGIEWDPGFRTRAYVTVYSAQENNRIVLTRVSPTLYTNENVSEARSGGYEFSLQQQVGDHVMIRGAYANSSSEIARDANVTAIGNLIPSTPRNTGYLSARWFATKSNVEAEVRSIGRAFADEQNTQPIDGTVIVDASASYDLGMAGSLYIEAQNIFNRQWLAEATTYAPPRAIMVGIRKSM